MSKYLRTAAWQRKAGKNPEGGLNQEGRDSYNKETGGNLKRPQPEGGKKRQLLCPLGWSGEDVSSGSERP